jgi:hypothetical protein
MLFFFYRYANTADNAPESFTVSLYRVPFGEVRNNPEPVLVEMPFALNDPVNDPVNEVATTCPAKCV